MIQEKTFENLDLLNVFLNTNNVKVINIETVNKEINTGLPLPKGGSFIYNKEVKLLTYEPN